MKRMIGKLLSSGLLAMAVLITGCGGGGGGGGDDGDDSAGLDIDGVCSVVEQKQVVDDLMHDVYYWYKEAPDVDPSNYGSKEALLDVLIQPEKDRGHEYSYLTTVAEEQAFLSNAAYVGFGFSMATDQAGRIFLRESFPGGPAHDAGMERGDEIISINGEDVSLMSTAQFNAALEADTLTFGVRHPDESVNAYPISKAEVELPVVGDVVHNLGAAQDTTYIFFRSFVDPAFNELETAFAAMKDEGDTKLILDLRYNGGGLVTVAQRLGSLIAGGTHAEAIVANLEFNDRYASQNQSYRLETRTNTVDVTDMVVITTGGTASASEMIINGLDPFINVATVGATSYGKPVGQSRLDFDLLNADCTDDILRGVTFKVVNADGVGEYYTGFQPICAADDDVLHQLGSADEESLRSALYYLENGGCDPAITPKAQYAQAKRLSRYPQGDPFIRDGWDLLIGGAR